MVPSPSQNPLLGVLPTDPNPPRKALRDVKRPVTVTIKNINNELRTLKDLSFKLLESNDDTLSTLGEKLGNIAERIDLNLSRLEDEPFTTAGKPTTEDTLKTILASI